MSQKNLCVYGKNGKRLGGGAAQLKRIKDCGGWDAYHKELISRVTEKVYEEVIEEKAYKNDYDNLTTRLLEEHLSYEVVINSLKDIAHSEIFK